MSIIEEIRNRNATDLDAAKELGRGLMIGDRSQFKLGYSNRNAVIAAAHAYHLDLGSENELEFYLLGYSDGLHCYQESDHYESLRERIDSTLDYSDAYDAGQADGMAEHQWNPDIYPAGTD